MDTSLDQASLYSAAGHLEGIRMQEVGKVLTDVVFVRGYLDQS